MVERNNEEERLIRIEEAIKRLTRETAALKRVRLPRPVKVLLAPMRTSKTADRRT